MRALAALILSALSCLAVTLEWDANKEPDIVNYTLKWGFVSGAEDHNINAGLALIWTVDEPWPPGSTVFFVVTATNMYGMESGPSNEVMYVVPMPSPTPTPAPTATPSPSPPEHLRIKLTMVFHLFYEPGSIIEVVAPRPPPGYRFARWDGDRAILSNFLERRTTATIPWMDVNLEGIYQ